MGFWSAMVMITIVCAITVVMLAKYGVIRGGRPKGGVVGHGHDEPEAHALRAELGQFRDRVAVLERIATENDRSLLLDREIEKLRRQPAE
jgi:hypothetical protein